MIRKVSLYFLSLFFVVAGTLHFLSAESYLPIMPPFLPYHMPLIYISGFFEVVLGIVILRPSYRKVGCYGLIALLIAVFPANIYMAVTNGSTVGDHEWLPLAAWFRLPWQFLMIAWAYWHSKDSATAKPILPGKQ